jgi:hypothetical protein
LIAGRKIRFVMLPRSRRVPFVVQNTKSWGSSKRAREVEGGSRIRVISADVPGAWGLGGTHKRFRVICEEFVEWRDERLWAALTSATGKAKDAQTLIVSNAGYDKDRSWQWKIRETARTKRWAYLYASPGVVASWIDEKWIEQQRALLPPSPSLV